MALRYQFETLWLYLKSVFPQDYAGCPRLPDKSTHVCLPAQEIWILWWQPCVISTPLRRQLSKRKWRTKDYENNPNHLSFMHSCGVCSFSTRMWTINYYELHWNYTFCAIESSKSNKLVLCFLFFACPQCVLQDSGNRELSCGIWLNHYRELLYQLQWRIHHS